jgi:hypothetical protein
MSLIVELDRWIGAITIRGGGIPFRPVRDARLDIHPESVCRPPPPLYL